MLAALSKNWWTILLRGVVAIIFAALAFIFPTSVLKVLVYLFGAFAIVDGICAMAAGITLASDFKGWWAILLQGILGILIGIATFFMPNITWQVLLAFIAAWATVIGIMELVAGIRMRKVIENEGSMIFAGILSILLGVLLVVFPAAGSVSLVWTLGVFAFVYGINNIVFAIRLKGIQKDFEKLSNNTFTPVEQQ